MGFFFNESDGLLMPLSGIYSKIENATTVFYFTKIDIVLERVRLVRGVEKWEDRK